MERSIVVIVDCLRKSPPSAGCDDCTPLLKDIIGAEFSSSSFAPLEISSGPPLLIYPLRLETKYYTADVGLCELSSPTIGDQKFADAVEAVIFFHDADCENLDEFGSLPFDPWLSFTQHWDAAVRIFACSRASSNDYRARMQQWCIKNDYEFVELKPDDEAVREAEECGELVGINRIMQALKAHSWSNLVMKDERKMESDRADRLRRYLTSNNEDQRMSRKEECSDTEKVADLTGRMDATSISGETALHKKNTPSLTSANLSSDIDNLLNDDSLFRAVNVGDDQQDPGGVSFEELFSQFAEMKERAESLPPEQRKAYAEKVTMAFWRAIGGDEGEIALSGSDDDDEDVNA